MSDPDATLPSMNDHADALHPVPGAVPVANSGIRSLLTSPRDADPAATSDRKAANALKIGDQVNGTRQDNKSYAIREKRGEPISNRYGFDK